VAAVIRDELRQVIGMLGLEAVAIAWLVLVLACLGWPWPGRRSKR
jgi:hypothetical protein